MKILFICTVTTSYLPLGAVLGFTLQFHESILEAEMNVIHNLKFFPFIVGILGAFCSTLLMCVVKWKARQYIFEHISIITFGLLFFVLGSVLWIFNDKSEFEWT